MCGCPERFAEEALGQASKAVHRAYAKKALMKLPSLEDHEKRQQSETLKGENAQRCTVEGSRLNPRRYRRIRCSKSSLDKQHER